MHIAIGYRWFASAAGYHLERALRDLDHTVTYVGLPAEGRPGYDNAIDLGAILATMPQPPEFYLWIDPAGRYFPPGIEDLPVPTAAYLIDVHLGHWRQLAARFFDAVFVAQKDYVDGFRRVAGHDQVHWLPLAAAQDVHRQWDLPRIYEVGFVGNMARAHRGTPRARRLKATADRFRTNDFSRVYMPEEVGQVYSQSHIIFNSGIAGDVTMRIFEGTACGALMLTDSTANGLRDLFEVGREIAVYHDDADLIRQIEYYLAHPEERVRIAQAGQARTQREHLYTHRAQSIVDRVSDPSFRRAASMRDASLETRAHARREIYTHLHMLDALLDEARAKGYGPLRRAWAAWPCLFRRLIV